MIYFDSNPVYPFVYVRNGFYQNGKLYLNLHNPYNAKSFYTRGSSANIEDGDRTFFKDNIVTNSAKNQQLVITTNHIYDIGFTLENDAIGGTDVIYYADGPWAIDKTNDGAQFTKFNIYPYSDTTNTTGKYLLERDVEISGSVKTVATLFRNIKAAYRATDMSNYNQIEFFATGSLPVEVIITKKSITDWSKQYRKIIYPSSEMKLYYVKYSDLTNDKGETNFTGEDVISVVFNTIGDQSNFKEFNFSVKALAFSKYSVLDIADGKPTASTVLYQSYPNPFSDNVILSFELQTPSVVKLELFDMLGNRVAKLADGYYPVGKSNIRFNTAKLAEGIYFSRLSVGQTILVNKLIKVK